MQCDLDRFYTPKEVARNVLAESLESTPGVCVDSTCGTGHLLEAANYVFGEIKCVGLDKDKDAISNLRRINPHWLLSVADLMNVKSYTKSSAITQVKRCDLLVLNPPFSYRNKKAVEIQYKGSQIRSSIAMAHILKSFELFNPAQGAIIIAPESLIYSETDARAREIFLKDYRIEMIAELKNCTFRGARAHATAVRIIPGAERTRIKTLAPFTNSTLKTQVIRGGLPVHIMKRHKAGAPFIHSTDIRDLANGKSISHLEHTKNRKRGRITGWVILIPRVGLPDQIALKPFQFHTEIQLSDCVIALNCSSKNMALQIEGRIRESWSNFEHLYRGTGARYITLSRLQNWLMSKNIQNTA